MIIYDFSGRHIYWDNIVEPTIRDINNFIFVFDFGNKSSLENLRLMIAKIKSNRSIRISNAIILGNKSDINKTEVSKDDLANLTKETGFQVHNVSIKEFEKVSALFKEFLNKK